MDSKIKILVVEDEGIVAQDIQNMLIDLGYDAAAMAASGEEAIGKVMQAQPDLILMDINIQGDIDGIETAEMIRKHFDIPIIYATAYAGDDILERVKLTDPFGYIIKPFEKRELKMAVGIALYKHRLDKERNELVVELETALEEIKTLRGILPICASCKKIRDDEGAWQDVAVYVRDHSEAEFTHGLCPDCMTTLYPEVSDNPESE